MTAWLPIVYIPILNLKVSLTKTKQIFSIVHLKVFI